MAAKSSDRISLKPVVMPAAESRKLLGNRRVMRSTVIRLANSPDLAPPIPSLTAKTKSAPASEASPVFPRKRTSCPLKVRARKVSSLFGRMRPRSVRPDQMSPTGAAGAPSGEVGVGLAGVISTGGFQRHHLRAAVQQCREFEIDDAKPPVGHPVGDIAQFPILVAHAILLELGEQFLLPRFIQLVDPPAAICGHNLQIGGVDFQQSGHKWAGAFFQM